MRTKKSVGKKGDSGKSGHRLRCRRQSPRPLTGRHQFIDRRGLFRMVAGIHPNPGFDAWGLRRVRRISPVRTKAHIPAKLPQTGAIHETLGLKSLQKPRIAPGRGIRLRVPTD